MLTIILLVMLQDFVTVDGAVKRYDMGEICGSTVSMDTDNIYGFEVLMYMTSQLAPNGSCRIVFDRRSDMEHLHFYFSEVDLRDCLEMSLHIYEADTINSILPFTDLPTVCGLTTSQDIDQDYTTSKRYLTLSLDWNETTMVRGTVFRLIANTYSCDETCGTRNKCDNGLCIHSSLVDQSMYNFCGSTLACAAGTDGDDDDGGNVGAMAGVVGTIMTIAFFVIFVVCACNMFRKFGNDNSGRLCDCIGSICSCLASAASSCCSCLRSAASTCYEGICNCLRGIKERLTDCCGRVKDSWDECSCRGEDQPVATPTDTSTATPTVMSEAGTNTDRFSVAAVTPSDHRDTDRDDEYESDFDNDSDVGATGIGTEAPPPSYTMAMATPVAPSAPPQVHPTAPPSYDAAANQPSKDEPPEYEMVMANKTFYGAKK